MEYHVSLEQYRVEYFDEEHRNWFLHPNLNLFRNLSRVIVAHSPAASVLDVGCGTGNLLRYLSIENKSLRLTGIDLAPCERVPGIDFLQGDFLETKFKKTVRRVGQSCGHRTCT